MEGNGYVQAVMNKLFEVSIRQESLASAFRKLTARNLSIIPVVEEERLVGIVTLQNLNALDGAAGGEPQAAAGRIELVEARSSRLRYFPFAIFNYRLSA